MYEFSAENSKSNQKIYSDQVSKDTVMLWLREKNVWNYFKLDPDSKVVESSDDLLKNIVNLTWVNLFTESLEQWDIINVIRENWPWFVFLTHYFGNSDVEKILDEYCLLEKRFYWDNEFIYWIVYRCGL